MIEPYIADELKVSGAEAEAHKKVFISMPMRDKTNAEIEAKRAQIKDAIYRLGYQNVEFIESFFKGVPHEAKPLWFLGESFKLLSQADIVYFAEDSNLYRGCCMERDAFMRYLLPSGAKGYMEIRSSDEARVLCLYNIAHTIWCNDVPQE